MFCLFTGNLSFNSNMIFPMVVLLQYTCVVVLFGFVGKFLLCPLNPILTNLINNQTTQGYIPCVFILQKIQQLTIV